MKRIGGCSRLRLGIVFLVPGVFVPVSLALVILALGVLTRPAWSAEVQYPLSIAVSESGDIYLADRNLHGVWKLKGESLQLFFEGSKNFRTPLNAIRCVAMDRDGKLLAGDSSTRDIYRFDETGHPVGLTQKPGAEPAPPSPARPTDVPVAKPADDKKDSTKKTSEKEEAKKDGASTPVKPAVPARPKFVFGQIGIPMDIAVAKSGDLYVSDLEIHRIVKVPKAGGDVQEFAHVQAPRGMCFDADDNLWVVSGRRLVRISPAGEKTTVVEDGVFNYPHTVAVGADKTAYVCDGYEKAIWKVPPGGKPEKLVSGEPMKNPVGMRLAGDKLYVVDPHAKAVFQITLDGKLTAIPLQTKSG